MPKAQEYAQWAKRLAETLRSEAGLAMALQAEALTQAALGDKKTAEETYLKCLTHWESAGWPYYQARALVDFSDTVAGSGARKHLEQAFQIFKKLGAKRELEKVQTKLSA